MKLLFEGKVFNTKGIQKFQCISIYFLMEIERGTGRDRCLQMPMSVEQCNILVTFTGGGGGCFGIPAGAENLHQRSHHQGKILGQ
jgi:hypothetical protein